MLHIILFQPQIPQNTGNIGRTCAITDSRLHLIHPLGFTITDKQLRRSGMDYWQELDVHHHENWDAFLKSDASPDLDRIFLFTTHATQWHWDASYRDGDGLLFGNEGAGAPDWLHELIGEENRIKIPHYKDILRSLNLSTAAGIATYEALRQIKS
ncbi:tRNA (cytidine(34)-2'-O)-methyltransferase [Puniceicoccaceae bacterium K14]|nr:tRNA (cytidine(34)-2'-O)-methyltransferase [Puniceicoccaceae bacterium K14]